jgi:hypothetical protein
MQKREQKVEKFNNPLWPHDSHRVTVGNVMPKEYLLNKYDLFDTNPLHCGTMRSIVATMARRSSLQKL